METKRAQMMHKNMIGLIWLLLLTLIPKPVGAQSGPVYAVFFHALRCPHCQYLIAEHIPLWEKEFGTNFQLVMVDINTDQGRKLFRAASETPDIIFEAFGVPIMIIGTHVLLGHQDIASDVPLIIRDGLKSGGIALPPIPGIKDYVTLLGIPSAQADTAVPSLREQIANGMAVGVLLALGFSFMLRIASVITGDGRIQHLISPNHWLAWGLTLGSSVAAFLLALSLLDQTSPQVIPLIGGIALILAGVIAGISHRWRLTWAQARLPGWLKAVIPLAAVAGLLVAVYLARMGSTEEATFCGLIGDCSAVQQSPYARLFGIIPVGLLGVIGYGGIILAWVGGQSPNPRIAHLSRGALLAMILFGVVMSAYLTFLEPFVIGATCVWCLISALIMLTLYWLTALERETSTSL